MSDINEVSKAIGRLEATQEQHGMVHTQILDRLDIMLKKQGEMSAVMPQMQSQIDEAVEAGRDYKKMKYKGLGFAAGVSAIFGGIAASIKDLLG